MGRRRSRGSHTGRDDWSKHDIAWANILHREIFETGDYFKKVDSVVCVRANKSLFKSKVGHHKTSLASSCGSSQCSSEAGVSCGSSQCSSEEPEEGESKPYLKLINVSSRDYLNQLHQLISSLEERVEKVGDEISSLECVDKMAMELQDKLGKLARGLQLCEAWSQDHHSTEAKLQDLREQLDTVSSAARELNQSTRRKYTTMGQALPSEMDSQLSSIELLAEKTLADIDEADSQLKKARTVRYDFQVDVEEVQFWISRAETKVQDRSVEPHQLKENLADINSELASITDQLATLSQNGKFIMEKSSNQHERELVQSTITNLTEQLGQVKEWISEKKAAVGDSIDSWQRFLQIYAAVTAWCEEKQVFVDQPFAFSNLSAAKLKLQDYQAAIKGIKTASKNVQDMNREFNKIAQVSSTGDLTDKLNEAENAKNDIEAQLMEKNALLQEMTEEWDQCEKKLKEASAWVAKSKDTLESLANKKRPIRDQLNLRDKMAGDIAIQRKRVVMALEKLHVHFREAMEGDQDVDRTAKEIEKELDALQEQIKAECKTLEACLTQLDQYQQEIAGLRRSILSAEQQLRTVSSPAYTAKDRDKALAEQSACRERIKGLQSKITAFSQRMNLINQRGTPDDDQMTMTQS